MTAFALLFLMSTIALNLATAGLYIGWVICEEREFRSDILIVFLLAGFAFFLSFGLDLLEGEGDQIITCIRRKLSDARS